MANSMKVCNLKEISPGTMKQFKVIDREVLLIRTKGQVMCLDARCTHAGAPLEEGTLEGDVLTCPWHGSQFRITDGSVMRGPAEKPIKVHLVTVKDEIVFIEI